MLLSRRLRMLVIPLVGGLVTAAIPAEAAAGHLRGRVSRAEGEIDDLEADLRYAQGLWRLRVSFEVEIEDAHPQSRFEMVLTLSERGRPLWDRTGRPITLVVPLVCPSDVDDDELEFERTVVFDLPADLIPDPWKLRIHGELIGSFDGRVLDRESESVKVLSIIRPPCRPIERPICGTRPRWR